MGQKVHPIGFRLGISKTWDSLWYDSSLNYKKLLHEDLNVRKYISYRFEDKGIWVSKVLIYRNPGHATFQIYVHEPYKRTVSLVNLDDLKSKLQAISKCAVEIQIVRLSTTFASAALLAREIALFLENQGSYKEISKKIISHYRRNSDHLGIGGVKVSCSGRFGGAAIARTEWFKEGQLPLQTLKYNIDYASSTAFTTYGVYGIKVWLFFK
jgi:small subunit ribosomal protein S3